ncbi:MAG TPA: hypothetical protein VGO37_20440 [Steroidobacteraceae bacterium]|jgi:hypothetical protein|nr:hypothetical protein [Steroidobacteraceae bacterium]
MAIAVGWLGNTQIIFEIASSLPLMPCALGQLEFFGRALFASV